MRRTISALLLFSAIAGHAVAQTAPHETRYPRAGGDLVVRSGEMAYRPSGPAPAFAQLDTDGNGAISPAEAVGYHLLANDFIKADANRDGRISQREYDRWASQP